MSETLSERQHVCGSTLTHPDRFPEAESLSVEFLYQWVLKDHPGMSDSYKPHAQQHSYRRLLCDDAENSWCVSGWSSCCRTDHRCPRHPPPVRAAPPGTETSSFFYQDDGEDEDVPILLLAEVALLKVRTRQGAGWLIITMMCVFGWGGKHNRPGCLTQQLT